VVLSRRGRFFSFFSMLFRSMKGLREASCFVRVCLIFGEMWGIQGSLVGVLGSHSVLIVLDPIRSLVRSLTEGAEEVVEEFHSWV